MLLLPMSIALAFVDRVWIVGMIPRVDFEVQEEIVDSRNVTNSQRIGFRDAACPGHRIEEMLIVT